MCRVRVNVQSVVSSLDKDLSMMKCNLCRNCCRWLILVWLNSCSLLLLFWCCCCWFDVNNCISRVFYPTQGGGYVGSPHSLNRILAWVVGGRPIHRIRFLLEWNCRICPLATLLWYFHSLEVRSTFQQQPVECVGLILKGPSCMLVTVTVVVLLLIILMKLMIHPSY